MEVVGVLHMFRQSEASRRVRYRYYLGDGDSAAFPTVIRENLYGPDCPIEKLECVSHVRKRMGTRLRKLKLKIGKTALSDGKKIDGRGRLTNSIIGPRLNSNILWVSHYEEHRQFGKNEKKCEGHLLPS